MRDIKLLDCTLRDGGYINDWEFGRNNLLSIYQRLVSSGVDIIEVGFIDDRRPFDLNRSIFPDTQSINAIYGCITEKAPMTVGMIDYGTCRLDNVQEQKDSWIDGIRVIFKKHLMHEALDYCAALKAKGYKVFAQLVSITSYNDEELLQLVELVNQVEPYAVSMVDTYGLITPVDLLHYYEILDNNVKSSIQIGFHAHNNLQLGFANALTFIQKDSKRNIVVDGTLHGMGKSAGNDPIELVADWMNKNLGTNYNIDQMLEAVEESVIDIYKKYPWDYKTFFYLSSKNKCHPNYVSFLQKNANLSISDLDVLLDKIEPEENKLLYKKEIAESLCKSYLNSLVMDSENIDKIKLLLKGRKILLIGPGKNIQLQKEKVEEFISKENPICISVNYIPESLKSDIVFVTNSARYLQMTEELLNKDVKILATNNIVSKGKEFDFIVNSEPLLERNQRIKDNSFLMLLKVLCKADCKELFCAGFDGYSTREDNYFNPKMEYSNIKSDAVEINSHIKMVLAEIKKSMQINFITYSHYEDKQLAED